MSEIKVDQLSPRTASGTITLGSSGDSLTIPSGVTLTNNGTASGFGKVLQVKYFRDSTSQNLATATYTDTDHSLSITPSSSSNKILCIWDMQVGIPSNASGIGVKLFRDATEVYASANNYDIYNGNTGAAARLARSWMYLDSPNTTSSVTYKVQASSYLGVTVTLNESATSQFLLMEIAA